MADQPKFADLKWEIYGRLRDRLFVARNAEFDWLPQHELNRCGLTPSVPILTRWYGLGGSCRRTTGTTWAGLRQVRHPRERPPGRDDAGLRTHRSRLADKVPVNPGPCSK